MHHLTSNCPRLICRIEGTIGWLLINNPEKRNAVDLEMWRKIPALINQLDNHPDVRVIILTSIEGPFCAGADIAEFDTERATAEGSRAYELENVRAFEAIAMAKRPTIAAISGLCFGAGAGLALSCDLRVAAEDALFSIPAAKLGVAYPPRAFAPIVAAIGAARTKELFFTARRVTAPEALAMGMLNRIVPAETVLGNVRGLAREIALGAPMTMTATKRAVDAAARLPVALSEAEVQAIADACYDSDDYREGVAAFKQKRKPKFQGK